MSNYPKINNKTSDDFFNDLKNRISLYTPEWNPDENSAGNALLKIAANMLGHIGEQVNKLPEKNFLAFLETIGIKLLPAQYSFTPIQFSISKGTKNHVLIPKNTEVSADEISFRTSENIYATPAQIAKIYSIDYEKDSILECPIEVMNKKESKIIEDKLISGIKENSDEIYIHNSELVNKHDTLLINDTEYVKVKETDGNKIIITASVKNNYEANTSIKKIEEFDLLKGKNLQEHILYLGDSHLFKTAKQIEFKLPVELNNLGNVQWEFWGEDSDKNAGWYPLYKYIRNDQLYITQVDKYSFKDYQFKEKEINGVKSLWIRCKANNNTINNLREVLIEDDITISKPGEEDSIIKNSSLKPEILLANNLFIDLNNLENENKFFYPFGNASRELNCFYMASNEVFSKKGAVVEIDFSLIEYSTNNFDTPIVNWEYWNGINWLPIPENSTNPPSNYHFLSDGKVSFNCPDDIQTCKVNGFENYWIRIKIVRGFYGKNAEYVGDTMNPAILNPPKLYDVSIKYSFNATKLEHCLLYNNLEYINVYSSPGYLENKIFKPFTGLDESNQAIYFGFNDKIEKGPISLLFYMNELNLEQKLDVKWYYYSQTNGWAPLKLIDYTQGLTKTGIIQFIMPQDFTHKRFFNQDLYWIKAVEKNSHIQNQQIIKGVFTNCVNAIQANKTENEIIGSSNGSVHQQFKYINTPLIESEVWINEAELITEDEKNNFIENYSNDINEINQNNKTEIWIKWTEVEDFINSNSKDRHYMIDHSEEKIIFGDSKQGMIPPKGSDNIKMNYLFGGGIQGNVEANTIKSLKSSIPYIDAVNNPLSAGGGANIEDVSSVLKRGPWDLRHQKRAVTLEDFERLALSVSSNIAKTKCMNIDGKLKIFIIPDEKNAKPSPNLMLLTQVGNYIKENCINSIPTNRIEVLKPIYKEISITIDIVPQNIHDTIYLEETVNDVLSNYFHPLTGGENNTGWEFGRWVYLSDIYALLEKINGVDYIAHLEINEQNSNLALENYETVCSGAHSISIKLGE